MLAILSVTWKGSTSVAALAVYRGRGHRRLDSRTYEAKCRTCIWGCRMPVEMIIDPWKPLPEVRHQFETFCYGPKSCPLYRPGPTRKVPGRRGMTWEEEDWVDADATSHRADDHWVSNPTVPDRIILQKNAPVDPIFPAG